MKKARLLGNVACKIGTRVIHHKANTVVLASQVAPWMVKKGLAVLFEDEPKPANQLLTPLPAEPEEPEIAVEVELRPSSEDILDSGGNTTFEPEVEPPELQNSGPDTIEDELTTGG